MRRVLLLAAMLAVALVYSLWSARPLWSDVALLAVLVVAVSATWRGWPALARPALAVLAAFTLAAAFSAEPLASWRAVLGVAAYGLVYLLLVNLLAAGLARAELYRALVIAAQLLFAVQAALWLQNGAPLFGYRSSVEINNSVALFTLLLMPALVVGEWRRLVIIEALAVAWWTASRAGVVGLVAGLLALGQVNRWVIVGLAVVAGLGLAARGDLLVSNGRAEMWTVAAQMFADSPLVGQGPGTYKARWLAAHPNAFASGHAHSLPLNLAAETGLIGLAAAGWLVVAVLRALSRAGELWARAALAATVGLLAHALFDVPTSAPYLTATWLALIAMGLTDGA
jgi:O-antigen ligase